MQHPGIFSSHLHHPFRRPRLAVLIDAENVSGQHAAQLMQLVKQRGRPTVCRAYGDWTSDFLLSWKKALHTQGIRPVQQFHYTQGKNASDATLIMDAMEVLHSGRVEGICIVSCDSDFVGLACRIQEAGLCVHGFGQHGASPAFVAACDEFVFLDGARQGADQLLLRQGLSPARK
jgi:hypothetical protein